jgi:hypothetical protein
MRKKPAELRRGSQSGKGDERSQGLYCHTICQDILRRDTHGISLVVSNDNLVDSLVMPRVGISNPRIASLSYFILTFDNKP